MRGRFCKDRQIFKLGSLFNRKARTSLHETGHILDRYLSLQTTNEKKFQI